MQFSGTLLAGWFVTLSIVQDDVISVSVIVVAEMLKRSVLSMRDRVDNYKSGDKDKNAAGHSTFQLYFLVSTTCLLKNFLMIFFLLFLVIV